MLRIVGDRGSGKTTALIGAFLKDHAGVLVFPNNAVRDYAFRHWPGLEVRATALPGNLDRVLAGRSPEARLYVDEIGMVKLSEYARSKMVAYSTS